MGGSFSAYLAFFPDAQGGHLQEKAGNVQTIAENGNMQIRSHTAVARVIFAGPSLWITRPTKGVVRAPAATIRL